MIIRFGLGLDSKLIEKPVSTIGFVTTGPMGLLSILETQLGLITAPATMASRIVQYRACLAACDQPDRFYHASFKVDALGVARTLLNWRDQLYAAGWNGTALQDAGSRLKDIAEVEAFARGRISPGTGERLQMVIDKLKFCKIQIDKLLLVDDLAAHPFLWQRLIRLFDWEHLNTDGRKPSAEPGTDLHLLQRHLTAMEHSKAYDAQKQAMNGDGSVIILKVRSDKDAARFLAEHICKADAEADMAVLVGNNGSAFDAALEAVDAPVCGFSTTTPLRPALQVLPLVLNLLWEPLDVNGLLQLLTHPVAPLPKRIRDRLANVVANSPGAGGDPWQRAIEEIIEAEKETNKTNLDELRRMRSEIDNWLTPERFDPDAGVPVEIIAVRCKQVAEWAGKMMGVETSAGSQGLFSAAWSQASALGKVLNDLFEASGSEGAFLIDRQQLSKLLDEVTAEGIALSDAQAQCGHVRASDNPAAFFNLVDTVIWSDVSMPHGPARYPWTAVEMTALANQGIMLQPMSDRLQYEALTWLRPILSAKKQIIFALQESDEAHHPVWDQISTCFCGWVEMDASTALQSGQTLPLLDVTPLPVDHKPLPGLKRWWQLTDCSHLKIRETESFSSLDAFIKSPYQWVLRYKAGLKGGSLVTVADGNLLKGSLAHRLFDRFFSAHPDWMKMPDPEIERWLSGILPVLIQEEGAVLLSPGRTIEKEVFAETCRNALHALRSHFKTAGIKTIEMEKTVDGHFRGGQLIGTIDMLLADAKKREVVLDVKWGGYAYRAADLTANRHLQLGVYAWLRKQTSPSRAWPETAYFIIENAAILAQSTRCFTEGRVCAPPDEEGTVQLWERFEKTWQWRRDQVNRGLIEVTVAGTEPDAESIPPEDGLDIDEYNDAFNDFVVLTGWEVDA